MSWIFSYRFRVIMPILVAAILSVGHLSAANKAVAAGYTLTKIVTGFKSPTSVVEVPDSSGRLVVTELGGTIRTVYRGAIQSAPFLDISSKVKTTVVGQGLYDIAFHPAYARNGYFFVSYVRLDGDVVLARYQVSAKDPNIADATSEKIILAIPHPHDFHYGGQIQFGSDGFLYYSMGDGGSASDKEGNSQNKMSLLGSLMRLDVDHNDAQGNPYTIPVANPFVSDPSARPELWAKGLRNPWRFSFDSATGDLYIADVGEAKYEEIDYQPAGDAGGENYGWSFYEGNAIYKSGTPATKLTPPVAQYDHSNGNCSITGGYVYRGKALPQLVGKYIFGDYCSGIIWSLEHVNNRWLITQLLKAKLNITSFGQDSSGEIYVVDALGETLYQLSP